MQEKVEAYLKKKAEERDFQHWMYCNEVKEYAGLLSDRKDFVVVSKREYDISVSDFLTWQSVAAVI